MKNMQLLRFLRPEECFGQIFNYSFISFRCFKLSLLLEKQDEVLYEVNANSDNWMIAGRKRGHVSVSTKQGS
jgi:hypothetical protein